MPHSVSPTQESAPSSLPNNEQLPKLFVNDGQLDPSNVARLKLSYPDEPLNVLRARYEEDGYVFLKGVIPRADVLRARSEYFSFLSSTGVLKPNTEPVEGIFDSAKDPLDFPGIGAGAAGNNGRPGGESAAPFVDLALKAHTEDWYAETFCKHPALRDFVSRFTAWGDENTFPIKRTLLRNNIPGTKAIGVHYDQIFLRHGEPTAVTAWVPIGDVSVNGGGLIYLENGHRLGAEKEADFTVKAMAAGLSEEEAKNAFNRNMDGTGLLDEGPKRYGEQFDRRWLVADYEAGDVVLHTPYTIHASTVNHDEGDRIRLATDLRFVDKTKKWDTRWNKHYELGDGV